MVTIEGNDFDGTCERIDLGKCPGLFSGSFVMDPCNCKQFYRCGQKYRLLKEQCSNSSLFNYKTGRCDHEDNVKYGQKCAERDIPWLRCDTNQTRTDELQALCTNTTFTKTSTPLTAPPPTTTQPTDGINAGMVVGLIIAGAVAAIVVAALIILFIRNRKKSKVKRDTKKRGTVAHNPEYFEGGISEDPYAMIDDSMTDPTYHGDTLPQSNGTMSTVTTTLPEPEEDDIVYDNSIPHPASLPADSGGYTDSISRDPTQEAYSRLATINENESNNNANLPSAEKPADNVTINTGDSSNSNMSPLSNISTLDSMSSANTGSGKSEMEVEESVDKENDDNEQNEERQRVVDYYTLEKNVKT